MNNRQRKAQPSVDDMLASIRKAIHGTSASVAGGPQPEFRPSVAPKEPRGRIAPSTRKRARPASLSPKEEANFNNLRRQIRKMDPLAGVGNSNRNSDRSSKFAGILSGDVRLEEALAKLQRAGLGDRPTQATQSTRSAHQNGLGIGLRGSHAIEDDIDAAGVNLSYADDESFDDLEFEETEIAIDDDAVGQPDYDRGDLNGQYQPQPVPEEHSLETVNKGRLASSTGYQAQDSIGAGLAVSEPLTSEESSQAVSSAFNKLADTIVGRATGGDQSIEGLTRELLRPMLKTWLDDNLPDLVEKLVREEIERVARHGGKV